MLVQPDRLAQLERAISVLGLQLRVDHLQLLDLVVQVDKLGLHLNRAVRRSSFFKKKR